jgi:hypothetical protein
LLVNRIFVCEIEHSGFVQRSFNGRSGLFAISPSQNLSLTLAPTRRFPPPWTGVGPAFKIAPTVRLMLLKSSGQRTTAQAYRGK